MPLRVLSILYTVPTKLHQLLSSTKITVEFAVDYPEASDSSSGLQEPP